jgi:hypothetical protein
MRKETQSMSKNKTTVDVMRRRALLSTAAIVAVAPMIKFMLVARADTTLPHLSDDDPSAKALKYHQDATKAPRVDKQGVPASQQFCRNCNFVKSDSGEWRPCQIFPGKAVNQSGWCSSWSKKAG